MLTQLSREAFKKLSQSGQRIAVFIDFIGDDLTPISALRNLNLDAQEYVLLESCDADQNNTTNSHNGLTQYGRYSFIGINEELEFKSYGHTILINENGTTKTIAGDPITLFDEYQQKYKAQADHPLAGFLGGLVGYMSYDAIRLLENIPDRHLNTDKTPDLLFKSFKNIISFDRFTRKIAIGAIVQQGAADLDKAFDDTVASLQQIKHDIYQRPDDRLAEKNIGNKTEVVDEYSDEEYVKIVNRALDYIEEGDAFQIVPSRCFTKQTSAHPLDIYRALRIANPSPYMFYINTQDYVIAGASPEKLISVDDGIIETCPIAGTRARLPVGDETAVEQELLHDPKEIAEHTMLIDLARNDIGRVAEIGSVAVTKLKEIVKFSHVMHISSTVQGKLRKDISPLRALITAFPAGTLSGAPKIRAMEIIDELERSRRGIYGGAVCMFDSKGNLNSCIAIRMAVIRGNEVTVRAGGGIVAESDPVSEAQETRSKASGVLNAIDMAERGL